MKELKKLISVNYDDTYVWFIRGNDGDIHIIMESYDDSGLRPSIETYDAMGSPSQKYRCSDVRVGVGNSGGQDVPCYVKKALSDLVDAFEKWCDE